MKMLRKRASGMALEKEKERLIVELVAARDEMRRF